MKHHGLEMRRGYWYVRLWQDGREIRQSTKTADITRAIAFRDELLASLGGNFVNPEWRAIVDQWTNDSNSWLCCAHANMRHKSRKRGWTKCIGFAEFVNIVRRSNGRCAITGIEMIVTPGTQRRHQPLGLSVDRIDSRLGYEPGNVRLVCLAVNIAMRNWGEGVLREIARAMVASELAPKRKPERELSLVITPEKCA